MYTGTDRTGDEFDQDVRLALTARISVCTLTDIYMKNIADRSTRETKQPVTTPNHLTWGQDEVLFLDPIHSATPVVDKGVSILNGSCIVYSRNARGSGLCEWTRVRPTRQIFRIPRRRPQVLSP